MGTVSVTNLLPEDPAVDRPTRSARATRGGRSRENTRERLVEASVDVFVSKGLKRVTVDDLTKAAGFTRGAFYSNFDSVDEVFFEAFRLRAQHLLDRAREAVTEADAIDVDFVLDLMRAMGGDREWLVLQSEFTLLALRDEDARGILTDFTVQLRGDLSGVISDVLHRLGCRPGISAEQLAQIVVGLQNQLATAVALGHLSPGPGGGGDPTTDDLFRRVLGALLAEFSEPLEQ